MFKRKQKYMTDVDNDIFKLKSNVANLHAKIAILEHELDKLETRLNKLIDILSAQLGKEKDKLK